MMLDFRVHARQIITKRDFIRFECQDGLREWSVVFNALHLAIHMLTSSPRNNTSSHNNCLVRCVNMRPGTNFTVYFVLPGKWGRWIPYQNQLFTFSLNFWYLRRKKKKKTSCINCWKDYITIFCQLNYFGDW